MQDGFVVDGTYGGANQSNWSPGPPRKSFWTGIKIVEDQLMPITVFRCTKCGFLESYARPSDPR